MTRYSQYREWRVAFYICTARAATLTAEARLRKRAQLGLGGRDEPAQTTCHWPDGRAIKPRRGTVGITKAVQRVLDSREALQLAGAEPYGGGGVGGGATAAPAAPQQQGQRGIRHFFGGSAPPPQQQAGMKRPAAGGQGGREGSGGGQKQQEVIVIDDD